MSTGNTPEEITRRAEERIGKILREKWCLDELLGVGGMACVYSATHRNGKRAAIKIMHPEAALVPDVRARFLREGYLANKVGHPGALSILDDDVDEDGTVYLVMELLEGENLEARWNRRGGRLDTEEVLIVAHQTLAVLDAAHQKGIVHRDLKPSNLFVDTAGLVKILDFGIARLTSVQRRGDTGGGHASLGTPGFMPPEQARGRWDEVDAQSDLWAVGATMFALLSGRYVHEGPTMNEQLLAAMTEQAEPLADVVDDVPASVVSVVDRALSFEKSDRWQSAKAMRDAVGAAYESIAGQSVTSAPKLPTILIPERRLTDDAPTIDASALSASTTGPVSGRERSERHDEAGSRRGTWLAAAAAAIALVGGYAWWSSSQTTATPAGASNPVPAAVLAPAPALEAQPSESAIPIASSAPPSPSAAPAPDAGSKAEPGAPRKAAAAMHAKPKPRPAARPKPKAKPAEKAAEAPGSSEVDIYSRRK